MRTTPAPLRALRDDPVVLGQVLHWAWAFCLTGPDWYRLATGYGHMLPSGSAVYPRYEGWP